MIGDISKSLDRHFVVGFFLPAIVLVTVGGALFVYESIAHDGVFAAKDLEAFATSSVENWAVTAAVLTLVLWLVAASLQTINVTLLQWLQGVHVQRIPRIGQALVRRRISKYEDARQAMGRRTKAKQREMAAGLIAAYPCTKWPAEEDSLELRKVRPFKFGNLVESFGLYSYKLYGLDLTTFWPHLEATMPEGCLRAVQSSKSQVDFFANLWLVWWIAAVESVVLGVAWQRWEYFAFAVVSVGSIMWLTRLLGTAGTRWGEAVMTASDIGRRYLAKEMGQEIPSEPAKERRMWKLLGTPMHFRMHPPATRAVPLHVAPAPAPPIGDSETVAEASAS